MHVGVGVHGGLCEVYVCWGGECVWSVVYMW